MCCPMQKGSARVRLLIGSCQQVMYMTTSLAASNLVWFFCQGEFAAACHTIRCVAMVLTGAPCSNSLMSLPSRYSIRTGPGISRSCHKQPTELVVRHTHTHTAEEGWDGWVDWWRGEPLIFSLHSQQQNGYQYRPVPMVAAAVRWWAWFGRVHASTRDTLGRSLAGL